MLALKRTGSYRHVISKRIRALNELEQWLSKSQRIVIVGIGNPIRRDDNIGVEIVSGLEGNVSETVLLIKSETVPESFIEPIIEFQPTNILIIDAALLNLSPGSVKLVKSLTGSKTAISTHALPIQIFCEYLIKMTQAQVAMLLIQPKDTSFGEGLTHELDLTRRTITKKIQSVVN
ncbi:MAG: hydrogenase maturation protease [Candidatus Bathyarchaeota archaeon]|nr:MAG: hydrogenase maturation protease [Candidatus Bathyarchaeota archaeon]